METIQPACCLSLQKQNLVAFVCQSEEMDVIIVTDIVVIFFLSFKSYRVRRVRNKAVEQHLQEIQEK